jgi:hypothetical protein
MEIDSSRPLGVPPCIPNRLLVSHETHMRLVLGAPEPLRSCFVSPLLMFWDLLGVDQWGWFWVSHRNRVYGEKHKGRGRDRVRHVPSVGVDHRFAGEGLC